MGKNYKGLYGLRFQNAAVGHTNWVATINEVFLSQNVWTFRQDQKNGHYNKVTMYFFKILFAPPIPNT